MDHNSGMEKIRIRDKHHGLKTVSDNLFYQESALTPFQRWELSLMGSTNMGQLFLHLTTLDNSVVWSKSIMNTKCRLCRRKTDPEKMLLCDGCDRGKRA
jgi:bromodomain adjacent to zinc finger domain protein 1A